MIVVIFSIVIIVTIMITAIMSHHCEGVWMGCDWAKNCWNAKLEMQGAQEDGEPKRILG
jgi:hypothetical protein